MKYELFLKKRKYFIISKTYYKLNFKINLLKNIKKNKNFHTIIFNLFMNKLFFYDI